MLLCSVRESLQYGIPSGLFLFALLVAQLKFELYDFTIIRWAVAITVTQIFSVLAFKTRTNGKLDFRVAWFGGFNILFVSVISYILVGYLMSGFILTLGTNELTFNLHVAIMEFFGLMTIGVLVITFLSYVFKRKD